MRVILFGLSTSAGRGRPGSGLPHPLGLSTTTVPCEVAASARPRGIFTGRSPSIGLPLVGHYKTYLSKTPPHARPRPHAGMIHYIADTLCGGGSEGGGGDGGGGGVGAVVVTLAVAEMREESARR